MNALFPAYRKLLAAIFALALALAPFSATADAQQKRRAPARETAAPVSVETALMGIATTGSTVLNSALSYTQADPYWQFRNARYSNDGLIPERDEIRLGNQIHVEITRRYQLTNEGRARVASIGQRVARASRRPNLAYRFYVLRNNQINAMSIPGGHIYVTTGLLRLANDDELASVLGHEVAHVVARHSLKTLQQSQALGGLVDIFGSITGIAGNSARDLGTYAARIVASGVLAAHNREEEREADFLGVRAMPGAGFNADGMITMFEKIQRLSRTEPDLIGSLFSDHPNTGERISNTRYEIDRMRREGRGR